MTLAELTKGNTMSYYTGIGSRATPADIQAIMTSLATKLEKDGYILRSGGANGADKAFELGVKLAKEIYLPWKGFEQNNSKYYTSLPEAFKIAERHHPSWDTLTLGSKKLMARNAHQVLGHLLDTPSSFLVCWTKDGCQSNKERTFSTGGTGLAISLADSLGIEIINLAIPTQLERIKKYINK